jgi:PAS domain S-box-containing protein
MTDSEGNGESRPLTVLHVDGDPGVRERVAAALPRERPSLAVRSAASAADALDRLDGVDCVLAAHAAATDGRSLLDALRSTHPDLPVVVYTPTRDDDVAATAIAAGATDVVPAPTGPGGDAVLATRVRNAAAGFRAARALDAQQDRFRKLVEYSSDVVSVVDANGVFRYLSPAARHVFGHDPADLVGEWGFGYLHPDDRPAAVETLAEAVADPTYTPTISFRFRHPDRGWVVLENTGRNLIDDPAIEGFLINSHDVTERVEHATALQRQRDRLAEFAGVVSHDLRNPLAVAGGSLALIEATGDPAHVADARAALERMEAIIDDLLTLAREGDDLGALGAVSLAGVAEAAWASVDTGEALLTVDTSLTVEADEGRLQRLLENLFSNAVSHAGPRVHVRVSDGPSGGEGDAVASPADGSDGGARDTGPTGAFAVADDGPGVPASDRDRIFDYGVSSQGDHTGFGLAIVRRVAEAHGWTVAVRDAPGGGAEFVFSGVRLVDDGPDDARVRGSSGEARSPSGRDAGDPDPGSGPGTGRDDGPDPVPDDPRDATTRTWGPDPDDDGRPRRGR